MPVNPQFLEFVQFEASNRFYAEKMAKRLIDENSKYYDIWYKDIIEMTDKEILEFFERTKDQMIKEDNT